ncbi:MAG: mandelate racemase/muconate lactonizing enzyme family protein [Lachnospiraceae bacterium]|nr:mandelate racemase/muconate lactonizing enzyme family protein [Lachnospiraceae bacterium]
MQIKNFHVYHISKKLTKPLPNAVYALEYIEHVFLELETEERTGVGMAYTFNPDQAEAMKVLVEGYCRALIGKDPVYVRAYWQKAQSTMGGCGQTGLPMSAYAVVDTALWDLTAQEAGMPLYKLLGARTDTLPVYGSGGWLVPQEEMIQEALDFKAQGYTRYKLKLGFPDWRTDVARLTALRAAVGDDFEIMVDVNQGWTVKQALRIAPYLSELGISYLEEPLHCLDYAGNAKLAESTDLTICSGECLFTTKDIFELLRVGGADMINPDLMRCGGVTEFREVCSLAAAFGVPVTAHVLMEVSAHVMAATPKGGLLEHIPDWWAGAFSKAPVVKDGTLTLLPDPGLGIAFDRDYIERNKYRG